MKKPVHCLAVFTSGAGLAILGSSLIPSAAYSASLFDTNLIINGDAESNAGSDGSTIGPITGFSTTGNFTAVLYGASGFGGSFPSFSDPGPADRGLNFFAGGPSIAFSSGSQLIDLSAGASAIDLGKVGFDLSAYLGGFSSQRDNAVLEVGFLGLGNSLLGSAILGPVTNAERSNLSGLLLRKTSGLLPVGTRFAQLDLKLSRVDGSYDDGYADNLSLILRDNSGPRPGQDSVPGPLSVIGVGAAFGWSRKLRMRVAKRSVKPK